MIRIITLSNKPTYLKEAIASVAAQTRKDIEHVVVLDNTRDWGKRYPPAVCYNEYARLARPADYVCWLSDDDLLMPRYVQALADFLDAHPNVECAYGGSHHVILRPDGSTKHLRDLPGPLPFPVLNAAKNPGFLIDGGQFMIRRSSLERIPYPYYSEGYNGARACDAHYMNKIVQYLPMHPVQEFVMTNRVTPLSSHVIPNGPDGIIAVDWQRA